MGDEGRDLTLSLSRVSFLSRNAGDRRAKIETAYRYYSRFDNVFTGPGIVDNGMVRELPRDQTADELAESLLIGDAQELIDKLSPYAEIGIDRVIVNPNLGCDAQETRDAIQAFAEDVMPHFVGDTE